MTSNEGTGLTKIGSDHFPAQLFGGHAPGLPAPKDVFKPGDRIHAAVIGIGSSDGLTLSARWSTAEGTEIATAGQSLAPTAPTVTTFAIAQPGPWPAGEYQVDIAINGRVVETGRFRVE
jgi:hypothetical protein